MESDGNILNSVTPNMREIHGNLLLDMNDDTYDQNDQLLIGAMWTPTKTDSNLWDGFLFNPRV